MPAGPNALLAGGRVGAKGSYATPSRVRLPGRELAYVAELVDAALHGRGQLAPHFAGSTPAVGTSIARPHAVDNRREGETQPRCPKGPAVLYKLLTLFDGVRL